MVDLRMEAGVFLEALELVILITRRRLVRDDGPPGCKKIDCCSLIE